MPSLFKDPPKPGTCILCDMGDSDEFGSGPLLTDKETGVMAHEFCMYFCQNLTQSRALDSSLKGFVPSELKEVRRTMGRRRCVECRKHLALAACHVCSKAYHVGCARRAGLGFEFFKFFRVYCLSHMPDRMICLVDPRPTDTCPICMEVVVFDVMGRDYVRPACCNASFLHRNCVQKMAIEFGWYHFACPMCRCTKQFRNEMLDRGIFLPYRDFSWNTQEDWDQLTARPDFCSSKQCICPKGSKHTTVKTWRLIFCCVCGSQAVHKKCCKELLFFCDKCDSHRDIVYNKKFMAALDSVDSDNAKSDDEAEDGSSPLAPAHDGPGPSRGRPISATRQQTTCRPPAVLVNGSLARSRVGQMLPPQAIRSVSAAKAVPTMAAPLAASTPVALPDGQKNVLTIRNGDKTFRVRINVTPATGSNSDNNSNLRIPTVTYNYKPKTTLPAVKGTAVSVRSSVVSAEPYVRQASGGEPRKRGIFDNMSLGLMTYGRSGSSVGGERVAKKKPLFSDKPETLLPYDEQPGPSSRVDVQQKEVKVERDDDDDMMEMNMVVEQATTAGD